MNYKKILLNIIILFCVAIKLDNAYAMDNAVVEQKSTEITFKSLHETLKGFPCCWSVNRIIKSWEKVPENTRKKIEKQIVASNDEQFLALFNVTKLPLDLQKKIANQLYSDKDAIKKFFNDPISDVIHDYSWSHKVFCGEELKAFRELCKDSSHWIPDVIFGHAKDIVAFESYRTNSSGGCNHKSLKSIAKVYNTFQVTLKRDQFNQVNYTFRDSYTLTNFMKYHSLSQWSGLPFVLMPFLLELVLPLLMKNNQLSVAEILSKNEKKEVLNAFIMSNFEKTGDRRWLVFIKKIISPDEYNKGIEQNSECNKMALIFFVYSIHGVVSGFKKEVCDLLDKIFYYFPKNVISALVLGGAYLIVFTILSAVLHHRFFNEMQHPLLGMVCATSCYAAAVVLWNVIKMRSVKNALTSIHELSELLQRTDIEII